MITKRFLGIEGLKYIQTQLLSGGNLPQLTALTSDIMAGSVFTYAKQDVAIESLLNFSSAITPPIKNSLEYTSTFVAEYLQQNTGTAFFVQDTVSVPGDFWLKSYEVQIVEIGGEIYELNYLNRAASDVSDVINSGKSASPLEIGLLVDLAICSNISLTSKYIKLDVESASRFIIKTSFAVVGAYDGEGYLIWLPAP